MSAVTTNLDDVTISQVAKVARFKFELVRELINTVEPNDLAVTFRSV